MSYNTGDITHYILQLINVMMQSVAAITVRKSLVIPLIVSVEEHSRVNEKHKTAPIILNAPLTLT